MTEKYIELKPQIVSDYALVGATAVQGGVGIALEWLDRHPEQVPGRTITESEIDNHIAIDITMRNGFILGFEAAGGRVVPDPEPTNAEQIIELMGMAPASMNRRELAKWLDSRGVKAPGGDDDQ